MYDARIQEGWLRVGGVREEGSADVWNIPPSETLHSRWEIFIDSYPSAYMAPGQYDFSGRFFADCSRVVYLYVYTYMCPLPVRCYCTLWNCEGKFIVENGFLQGMKACVSLSSIVLIHNKMLLSLFRQMFFPNARCISCFPRTCVCVCTLWKRNYKILSFLLNKFSLINNHSFTNVRIFNKQKRWPNNNYLVCALQYNRVLYGCWFLHAFYGILWKLYYR